jgi:chromosomal replication initiation ATPase DnaA
MPEPPRPGRPGEPPRQLALELPVEERMGAEDFLVSPSNEDAYAVLESWPAWTDPVLLLVGPPGAGKTHCAAIWAARSHAWRIARADLRDEDVPRLLSAGALVIEDCDQCRGQEDALFHLLNAARERRSFVLLTARTAPGDWGLRTPDLLSRLRLAPCTTLREPDDALVRAILVKLFLERQLVVDTCVVEFLVARIERSVAAAKAIVDALDREGLERGRRITRPLAAELLRRLEGTQPPGSEET